MTDVVRPKVNRLAEWSAKLAEILNKFDPSKPRFSDAAHLGENLKEFEDRWNEVQRNRPQAGSQAGPQTTLVLQKTTQQPRRVNNSNNNEYPMNGRPTLTLDEIRENQREWLAKLHKLKDSADQESLSEELSNIEQEQAPEKSNSNNVADLIKKGIKPEYGRGIIDRDSPVGKLYNAHTPQTYYEQLMEVYGNQQGIKNFKTILGEKIYEVHHELSSTGFNEVIKTIQELKWDSGHEDDIQRIKDEHREMISSYKTRIQELKEQELSKVTGGVVNDYVKELAKNSRSSKFIGELEERVKYLEDTFELEASRSFNSTASSNSSNEVNNTSNSPSKNLIYDSGDIEAAKAKEIEKLEEYAKEAQKILDSNTEPLIKIPQEKRSYLEGLVAALNSARRNDPHYKSDLEEVKRQVEEYNKKFSPVNSSINSSVNSSTIPSIEQKLFTELPRQVDAGKLLNNKNFDSTFSPQERNLLKAIHSFQTLPQEEWTQLDFNKYKELIEKYNTKFGLPENSILTALPKNTDSSLALGSGPFKEYNELAKKELNEISLTDITSLAESIRDLENLEKSRSNKTIDPKALLELKYKTGIIMNELIKSREDWEEGIKDQLFEASKIVYNAIKPLNTTPNSRIHGLPSWIKDEAKIVNAQGVYQSTHKIFGGRSFNDSSTPSLFRFVEPLFNKILPGKDFTGATAYELNEFYKRFDEIFEVRSKEDRNKKIAYLNRKMAEKIPFYKYDQDEYDQNEKARIFNLPRPSTALSNIDISIFELPEHILEKLRPSATGNSTQTSSPLGSDWLNNINDYIKTNFGIGA